MMVCEVMGSRPAVGESYRHDGRTVDERAGDGNAAAHAAGEFRGQQVHGVLEFDEAQNFADARLDLFLVHTILVRR